MNNNGQQVGLVAGLIFGIASLVIGVMIAFVMVSTLTDADLLSDNRASVSVINETGAVDSTGTTLSGYSAARAILSSFAVTTVYNGTLLIPSSNYTLAAGVVTNATSDTYGNGKISYTYNLYNVEEKSVDYLSTNFTSGVDNVSEKLPTVLTVAAVVLILGVLVLLVAAWQRMRLGGGSI